MTSGLWIRDLRLPTGQRVDLRVGRGQIHCVGGDSGVGKSRFLRAIADLDPCAGSIALDDVDREALTAAQWRRQVMLVPAVSRWWRPNVREHLQVDAARWAPQLGLDDDRLDAPVSELSTGERARAALLRALLCEPAVLMLDEPTGSLDESNRGRVEQAVQDYARDHAVIWITHDRAQARRVGTHRWTLTREFLREDAE